VFEDVTTVEVTAPTDVLYQRLIKRGREKPEQLQSRLERTYDKINAKKLITFNNCFEKEVSSQKFIELLKIIEGNKTLHPSSK
jgi:ribose 1,5-bisphosphokinase